MSRIFDFLFTSSCRLLTFQSGKLGFFINETKDLLFPDDERVSKKKDGMRYCQEIALDSFFFVRYESSTLESQ